MENKAYFTGAYTTIEECWAFRHVTNALNHAESSKNDPLRSFAFPPDPMVSIQYSPFECWSKDIF